MTEIITIGLVGLIAVLAILLVYEVSKQNSPHTSKRSHRYRRIPVIPPKRHSQPKPRYQRVPVIPPKRHSPPPPPAPLAVPPIISEPPAPPSSPTFSNPFSFSFKPPKSNQPKRTLPVHHPLRIKLMAMVGGDTRTADRLLQQCQKNNPGMDLEWYFDKVIYDLVRDRR